MKRCNNTTYIDDILAVVTREELECLREVVIKEVSPCMQMGNSIVELQSERHEYWCFLVSP